MPRLLFEKKGNAVWISHLDLMRVFQRAFKRAGLPLKHTQGFNPRPFVSIALPLSVGIESQCELLDFELDGEERSEDEIREKLNHALVSGVRVLDVFENASKLKELVLMKCALSLVYDSGIPENCLNEIENLFSKETVTVEKKNKNGVSEQNIIPMIQELNIKETDRKTLEITAVICCQNPSLNPMQLHAAISKYLPEFVPNDVLCRRIEIYNSAMEVFR